MGYLIDRVIASFQHQVTRESDATLGRHIHFPTHFDPFFTDTMTLADLYHCATLHFEYHASSSRSTRLGRDLGSASREARSAHHTGDRDRSQHADDPVDVDRGRPAHIAVFDDVGADGASVQAEAAA